MLEIIFRSVRGIFLNKGRTLLTLTGIAVGVAAVMLTNYIGAMGREALSSEIDGLGMGGLSVTLKNENAPLTRSELEEIKSLSYVKNVMPLVFENTEADINGESRPVYLWGIDYSAERTISLHLMRGRFFDAGDISSGAKVCMVDEKFALDHFGTDHIVGRSIVINCGETTDRYQVVGILKTGSGLLQNVMGSYIPDFVYIPYSTMQNHLSSKNFSQIIVKTDEHILHQKAEKELSYHMERRSAYKNAYIVTDLAQQKESLDGILNIFSVVLSLIGAVSLLVAGLNIMNVMLITVSEQTKEIGIKKAIGAGKGYIIAEYLAKSAFLSLAGCLLGILLAWAAITAGAFLLGLTPIYSVDIMIGMILFSVLSGALFGIYPAKRAADLDPVEALRYF